MPGGDGLHTAIGSWVWDSWTPDPAGTGGILTSDYVTVDWAKVDYLDALGLFPWFTLPTAHRLVSHCSFSQTAAASKISAAILDFR